MKTLPFVEIYTDGACSGNPGPGGWAALLRYGKKEKTLSGAEKLTTNNRMELTAVIKALAALKGKCKVSVTTDSQYVKKGITEWVLKWQHNGWKGADKKVIKNLELWQRLHELAQKHDIEWHWVRGHAGHYENEVVDDLARRECDK